MKAEITPQEYEAFKSFLQDACGILLGENKQYLVKAGCAGFSKRTV